MRLCAGPLRVLAGLGVILFSVFEMSSREPQKDLPPCLAPQWQEVAEKTNRSTLRVQESEYLRAGDLFEVQGRLDEALMEYQRGFSSGLSKPLQAAFPSRIARCQFKRGDYGIARRTCERIIDEDNNEFYAEGMPYILVARLASGTRLALVAKGEDPLEAISTKSLLIYYLLLGSHSVTFKAAVAYGRHTRVRPPPDNSR